MNLSGAGAKAVVALLLHGPLPLERLIEESGVRRGQALWAGLAQAEKLGLVTRIRRGRRMLYGFPFSSISLSEKTDGRVPFGNIGLVGSSSYYTYPGLAGDKIEPQGGKIEPSPQRPGRIIEPSQGTGDKIEPQGQIIEPVSAEPPGRIIEPVTEPGDKIEPSPLDAVIAADSLPLSDYSVSRNSPYVKRRAAQMDALMRLWAEVLPDKPLPPRPTFDRLLREAGNRAYFVAVTLLDMASKGKNMESPVGYLVAAIKGRTKRGDIPLPPQIVPVGGDEDGLEEMTPELAAQIDRVNQLGAWGSDDD